MKHQHPHTPDCDCATDLPHILERAEAETRAKGERFTTLRREVIAALAKAGKPLGAYDLLKIMNRNKPKKISAMSLYRTLDYLLELGLALRLESKNAYMLCPHGGHDHGHVILVCDDCGDTKEIEEEGINQRLAKLAEKNRLKLRHNVVELHGLCSRCQ